MSTSKTCFHVHVPKSGPDPSLWSLQQNERHKAAAGCCCHLGGNSGLAQQHNCWLVGWLGAHWQAGLTREQRKGEGLPPSYFPISLLMKSQETELNQQFFTSQWYCYPVSSWEWKLHDTSQVSNSAGGWGSTDIKPTLCSSAKVEVVPAAMQRSESVGWHWTHLLWRQCQMIPKKYDRHHRVSLSCTFQ